MKPLCKWSGGKRNEIKIFSEFYPKEYKTFIEPFVGGGATYFDLNFDGDNVINDTHPELINFYEMIKSGYSHDIFDLMISWGTTEEDYYKVRKYFPTNDVERAAKFFYLRKTCFRGMLRYNSSGEFNIPWGRYKSIDFTDILDKKYEELLKRTNIWFGSYKDVFEIYNSPDNFVFLDPPYDSEFSNYGFDDFTKQSQIELSEIFKSTKNKCMLVISETPLIKELYSGYIVHSYPKKYAFKIYAGRIGDEINKNHLVITNY